MKVHLIIILLISATVVGQSNKFQLGFGGDLGFGTVEINDLKSNSFTQSALIQLSYNIGYISINGGVEYNTTQSDGELFGNSHFSEFKSLRIPVGISTHLNFSNPDEPKEISFPKIYILLGLGLYGNYLMKYEIENLAEDTNLGWNLGSYGEFGIKFNVNSVMGLEMGFKKDYDFSEIEKENTFSYKQNRNIIFLRCAFKI